MTHSPSSEQAEVRTAARSARAALSRADREKHSIAIATRLAKFLPFRKAKRIAVYMSMDEEVDTGPIIELCLMLGKDIFLPVINRASFRNQRLLFHRFVPGGTPLVKSRFGILEPKNKAGNCIRGGELDLVCVPTVAFSKSCDRIGMGGGYYDRAFASRSIKPVQLVGIAFDCQQADFHVMAHDVPMDAVVTESQTLVR